MTTSPLHQFYTKFPTPQLPANTLPRAVSANRKHTFPNSGPPTHFPPLPCPQPAHDIMWSLQRRTRARWAVHALCADTPCTGVMAGTCTADGSPAPAPGPPGPLAPAPATSAAPAEARDAIWGVLSDRPVCNEFTVYAAVMVPREVTFNR